MKQVKAVFKRISFLMLILLMLIALSIGIYNGMIKISEADCNEQLNLVTKNMADRISVRFIDHMNLLDYVSDAVALRGDALTSEETLSYLSSVQESPGTFFDRIDIILSDGTQICQQGDKYTFVGVDTFNDMASRGTHISPRLLDDRTGREVIYCGSPIEIDGEVIGILMGMIDCEGLNDEFISYSYDKKSYVFLVDNRDGNYLIDEWHTKLGNIKDLGERELLNSSEKVDFSKDLPTDGTQIVGFISEITGQKSYMAYSPVEGFPWTVAVMVDEEQVFERVNTLRNMFLVAGAIEAFLLLFYILWNIYFALRVVKNEEQLKIADVEKTKAEAKSVFLSSISHDIRTPLNGILGMLTIIKGHKNVPEETRIALKKVEDSAKYLENLTNDVLDLNEIENGKVQLDEDNISLNKFINKLTNLVQNMADDRQIKFSVDLENIEHDRVCVSRVHLQRVLVNLLTNAIKYNYRGGWVKLMVEEKEFDGVKSNYIFTVKDNGIGMSAEFQKNMFNSFEQEISGARSKHTGHGLGLPIVKKLVDIMGGTIEVESEKEKGSCFVVSVKLNVDTDESHSKSNESAKATDLTGIKILVAEDNELNMEIAQTLLSTVGAVITPAENGRIAVDLFSDSEIGYFDVILMDVMMPELTGLEATEKIRKLKRADASTIPIIAMTAKTFAEDVKSCLEAGMNEHIAKPIEITSLIEKINKYKK